MRRLWMGVALTLVAHAALAAVQYEFIQTSRSDSDTVPAMDLSARAIVDGPRSRVDFISGNTYPPGTYVISSDGARRLSFIDPTQKTYTEVNTATIASAIGMSNIKVENLKSSVMKLDDQPIIAGHPTDHYRLTLTFDITVTPKIQPLRQTVRAEIDKWTTVRFGDAGEPFSKSLLTGNEEVDKLILAETTKIRGFPLKQTVKITAINTTTAGRPTRSQLKLPASITMTRETTVTAIRETGVDERLFNIPAGFSRSDFADSIPKPQTQVLSFDPPSR